MDQYGNPGPFQDPKVRQWWDELEVEESPHEGEAKLGSRVDMDS